MRRLDAHILSLFRSSTCRRPRTLSGSLTPQRLWLLVHQQACLRTAPQMRACGLLPPSRFMTSRLRHIALESQETVWAAPGVSGAHRVGACQSPGPQVIMNELGSYIRVESNDSSWSTFVGCQGVACRALMIGSPRCSRGWTNGNRQTSTWSIQQDHIHTAPLGLTSLGTYPALRLVWFMLTLTRSHTRRGLRMAMPCTTWRH